MKKEECTSEQTAPCKKVQGAHETLLQTLRNMSRVDRNSAGKRKAKVRDIILTEASDARLTKIVKEVPNVDIKYYKVDISLVQ